MTEPVDVAGEAHEQLARLGSFLRRAARFWPTAVGLILVGAAACAIFLFVRKPAYRSETVILYSEGIHPADDAERPETPRSVTVRLKEILMSRSSLDAVVRQFDLYPDVRRSLGPVDAVEELRHHVEFRAPGGDTFSIGFVGDSPQQAQRVTARLAELVIDQDSELRKKQALVARDFLSTEKRSTETQLRDAEQALAAFMGAHPRFALDATPLATGAAIRASMSAAAAVAPSAMKLVARATGQGAPASGAAGAPASEGAASDRGVVEEASRAAAALAAAQANLTDLSARFTPAHPDVRAAAAEAERARARVAAATAAATAAARYRPANLSPAPAPAPAPAPVSGPPSVRATQPADRVAAAPPREPDVVALETEWVKLTRAVTEARQHQDQVEGALFKANLAVSSETGGHGVEVTMIDPAFLPQSPMPPGRTLVGALFLGVSLAFGIASAIVRALLDDRVVEARDVSRFMEVLAAVPRTSTRRAHGAG